MKNELADLDAMAQAELVRTKEVRPVELVDAAIERLEAANVTLNFVAGTDFDAARRRARGPLAGPLAGVPYLLKDLAPYPGLRHSLGCRLFAQNEATESTPLGHRLDEAGLVVVGKTTTSELGLLGSTETLLEGRTLNPWDLTRSAGGSSGGAAVAVAQRVMPMAHASDGGGSIRIPAAMNGVFGLKPSARRVAAAGPDDMNGLVTEHCVSVSVRDSALMLSLTEQPMHDCDKVGFVEGPSTARLKIGLYAQTLMGDAPTPSIEAALQATAQLCRDLGHEVVTIDPPPIDGRTVSDAFFTLAGAFIQQLSETFEPILGRPVGPDELEPFTLALLDWYQGLDAGARDRALQVCQVCQTHMKAFLQPFDVVLCPTIPIDLPALGTIAPTLPRAEVLARTEQLAGFTPIHNMARVPAMSVPLHWSDEGWPIGSHFAAPYGHEARLLHLAYELEAAAPWRDRRPCSSTEQQSTID